MIPGFAFPRRPRDPRFELPRPCAQRKRGNGAERLTEPIIPRYDFRGLAQLTVTVAPRPRTSDALSQ